MRIRFVMLTLLIGTASAAPDGEAIYKEHCASCHGKQGEGVASEYDEALVGKRSIESLTRLIHKTMPEDEEEKVINADAKAVAVYIYNAFYSPAAQAKLNPVRKNLLRRTQHQHRNAIADLVGSFRGQHKLSPRRGLNGHYFNAEKMNKRKTRLLDRIDTTASFDLAHRGEEPKLKKINPRAFSIDWRGALLPPETGTYQFRISTPNGARLFLNTYNMKNKALIDAWVSSGNKMRTTEGKAFLLGGYPIPIVIEFTSYQEKKSSVLIEWKPPHGTWQKIPQRYLSPDHVKPVTIVSTTFPADDASLGYERGSTISKAWNEAAARAAMQASSLILTDIDKLAKTKPNATNRAQRLKAFCLQFTQRAYGRPLSKVHSHRIQSLFANHPPEHAAKRSIMLTLTSPYFLYPGLNLNAQHKPDDFSNASHLALALWDSVPDQQLTKAALKGELNQPWQIRLQAKRMLNDPRTKHKTHRFFYQWLHLSEKDDLAKDLKTFPGFNAALIADLRTSLDLFLESVVWSGSSNYKQLFLSKDLFMNSRLAAFYGVPEPEGNQFAKLPAPDRKRAGIFTHPYVLSAFSYHKQTSPIHRGVYLSRNVLGRFLKPPPKATVFKDADFNPHFTMREKVTQLTKEHSCMVCHEIINPIGFSLENYDAVGRFRTKEKNKLINTESTYTTRDDREIRIKGPQDLARLAVESPGAHRSFIKHLFHHLIQQPTAAYGYTTMDDLHQRFQKDNFHIQRLILSISTQTIPHLAKKP
ncbi:MAG: DUF1592 domain-containing protein [Akkermansiaceae bacterium]